MCNGPYHPLSCPACAAWDWKGRSHGAKGKSSSQKSGVRMKSIWSVLSPLCFVICALCSPPGIGKAEVRGQNEEDLLSAVHFLPSALCLPPVSSLAIPLRRGLRSYSPVSRSPSRVQWNRSRKSRRVSEERDSALGAAVMLSGAKHPCSLSLDAERKRQLRTRRDGFAREKSGRLSRNSTHYSFPLSSLGQAWLICPRPATNPSPGPRRLVKAPSRSTLSPWERADPLCGALRF